MNETAIDPQIEIEIHKAILARKNGKEGQARVCARRAAGIGVRRFFEENSYPVKNKSVYELLTSFINQPGIPSPAKQNAINLTMRVSESFLLPVNVDLIKEARSLCEQLANLKINFS